MELQTGSNLPNICSLCLKKSNYDVVSLSMESQLGTIYYNNILAGLAVINTNLHLLTCDNCLQQLKSYQNFIKTCQNSYQLITNERHLTSVKEEVEIHESPEDYPLSEVDDVLEDNIVQPEKPKNTWGRAKLCPHCGKQFLSPCKLQLHLSVHTGDAPFKCSFCDKRMRNKTHLRDHERTHTGEKPYICSFCKKAFIQRNVLNTHMKIHTGRNEKCNICSKTFCRSSELRIHMRLHTGEEPYKCPSCEKTFRTLSNYKGHLLCHSEERHFICKHCGAGFKRNVDLKKHEAIHTDEMPITCKLCDYACRKPWSLKMHVKNHHS